MEDSVKLGMKSIGGRKHSFLLGKSYEVSSAMDSLTQSPLAAEVTLSVIVPEERDLRRFIQYFDSKRNILNLLFKVPMIPRIPTHQDCGDDTFKKITSQVETYLESYQYSEPFVAAVQRQGRVISIEKRDNGDIVFLIHEKQKVLYSFNCNIWSHEFARTEEHVEKELMKRFNFLMSENGSGGRIFEYSSLDSIFDDLEEESDLFQVCVSSDEYSDNIIPLIDGVPLKNIGNNVPSNGFKKQLTRQDINNMRTCDSNVPSDPNYIDSAIGEIILIKSKAMMQQIFINAVKEKIIPLICPSLWQRNYITDPVATNMSLEEASIFWIKNFGDRLVDCNFLYNQDVVTLLVNMFGHDFSSRIKGYSGVADRFYELSEHGKRSFIKRLITNPNYSVNMKKSLEASQIVRFLLKRAVHGEIKKSTAMPAGLSIQGITHVSPKTVAEMMTGNFQTFTEVILVDCRFAHEYNASHIVGAVNLPSKKEWDSSKNELDSQSRKYGCSKTAVVFYSERNTRRAFDVAKHFQQKSRLGRFTGGLEHIFILEGGYHAFFQEYLGLCSSAEYVKLASVEYRQHALDAVRSNGALVGSIRANL